VPRDATVDPLLGQVIDERYRLIERLGGGGMGSVYRAERISLGRTVAVKFLLPSLGSRSDFVQRFQREAMAMSKLYHVHCAALYDCGVHGGAPYLVIEYIPGRTLASDLRSGPLSPARAIGIMRQVLEALRYLHRRNIVHRDLKPQNVMLVASSSGVDFVKVLDFGMAKVMAGERRDITVQGLIVGTPSVMAPEQIRQRPVDGRTDIYAAGILLYEMVVGHKPFQHPEMDKLMMMQLEATPVPPRRLLGPDAITPALEAVILKALAKAPEDRYQSAQEMSDALATAAAELDQPAGAAIAPRPRRTALRVVPYLLAVLLLLLGVLFAQRLGL
jgi:eukaryotic-like serine/threonine-protein kinase